MSRKQGSGGESCKYERKSNSFTETDKRSCLGLQEKDKVLKTAIKIMSNEMTEVRGTIAYKISSIGIIRKSSSIKRNSLRGTRLSLNRIALEEENTIVGKMYCGIQLIKRK